MFVTMFLNGRERQSAFTTTLLGADFVFNFPLARETVLPTLFLIVSAWRRDPHTLGLPLDQRYLEAAQWLRIVADQGFLMVSGVPQ